MPIALERLPVDLCFIIFLAMFYANTFFHVLVLILANNSFGKISAVEIAFCVISFDFLKNDCFSETWTFETRQVIK